VRLYHPNASVWCRSWNEQASTGAPRQSCVLIMMLVSKHDLCREGGAHVVVARSAFGFSERFACAVLSSACWQHCSMPEVR
jgi:hypothetical protein